MKQRRITKILAFWVIGFFVLGVTAFADDIKARMKNRLPEIKQLKAQGIVGEDNKGYLQFVGGNKAKADVVAAENKDRKTVYTAIAKCQTAGNDSRACRKASRIANCQKSNRRRMGTGRGRQLDSEEIN
jgi:uncharacterized protein YdbL (DUF1318 family)